MIGEVQRIFAEDLERPLFELSGVDEISASTQVIDDEVEEEDTGGTESVEEKQSA